MSREEFVLVDYLEMGYVFDFFDLNDEPTPIRNRYWPLCAVPPLLAALQVLGGIIGAGVDAANGAMNELTPNPLHVMLEEISGEQVAVE